MTAAMSTEIETLLADAGWQTLTWSDDHIMIQRDDALMVEGYVRPDGRAVLWVGSKVHVLLGGHMANAIAAAGAQVRRDKTRPALLACRAMFALADEMLATEAGPPPPDDECDPTFASAFGPCQGEPGTTVFARSMAGEISV